jgi:MerR family transcriptional regulator/heat shock protein HspR
MGYMISAVSEMYEIHPQTLRQYEREGLMKPSRSDGNTRLYTDDDLDRLEIILSLTRELGVNLAGVEIILNMRDRMEQVNSGLEKMFTYLRGKFGEEFSDNNPLNEEGLIRVGASQIVRMEIEKKKNRKN